MKNRVIKIVAIIVISILIISFLNIRVLAVDIPEQFQTSGFENKDGGDAETITKTALETVLAIAKVVSIGVAVIMLIILAMKYMMASAGERAEIKKHATVYVVGAIIMFGASGILSILEGFANNIS